MSKEFLFVSIEKMTTGLSGTHNEAYLGKYGLGDNPAIGWSDSSNGNEGGSIYKIG